MPSQVVWFNQEKTIIRHIYTHDISLQDYYDTIDINAEMLAGVSHPVDMIIDLSNGEMKFNRLLSAAKYVESNTPENQRLVIVVNGSSYLRAVIQIAATFAPKATRNIVFVDTLDKALAHITQYTQP